MIDKQKQQHQTLIKQSKVQGINSNNILFLDQKNKEKRIIYFLPAYLRVHYLQFNQLNIQSLSAKGNCQIYLNIYYGDLPSTLPNIINVLQQQLRIRYQKSEDQINICYDRDKMQKKDKISKEQQILKFHCLKQLKFHLKTNLFLTPFQTIQSILSLYIKPILYKESENNQERDYDIILKFNLMGTPLKNQMITFNNQIKFGKYDLAQKKISPNISCFKMNEIYQIYQQVRKNQSNQKQWKLKQSQVAVKNQIIGQQRRSFCFAHYKIQLYKRPAASLVAIFLQLWFLSIINISIYFQDSNLSTRISSIATLAIAFVVLMPVVRSQLPITNKITFLQILVGLETISALLCLIRSLNATYISPEQYKFIWYEDGLFISSVIITIWCILSVFILTILHYFKWQSYLIFKRNQWFNQQCNFTMTQIYQTFGPKQAVKLLSDN